jgi:hypothetical protein
LGNQFFLVAAFLLLLTMPLLENIPKLTLDRDGLTNLNGEASRALERAVGVSLTAPGVPGSRWALVPVELAEPGRLTFHRAAWGTVDSIRVGQKAGFDYGRGIHHVGAVAELGRPVRAGRAPRSIWTLAGNEGTGTTAGVKHTLYPIGAIDGLANWN